MTGCETTGLSPREQQNGYASLINGAYQTAQPSIVAKPIRAPIHLAVAQIGESTPQSSFISELKTNTHLVRAVTSLPMPGDQTQESGYGSSKSKATTPEEFQARLNSARTLSRDIGAQYLLVVGGEIDSFSSRNAFSVLDVTLVGGWIFPSVDIHADGKASAALIDVESGRVIFIASAERKESALTPSVFSNDKRDVLRVKLREALLADLASDVLNRLMAKTEFEK